MNISQTDLITITKNLSILEFKTRSKDDKKLIQEIFDIFNTAIEKEKTINFQRDALLVCSETNKENSPLKRLADATKKSFSFYDENSAFIPQFLLESVVITKEKYNQNNCVSLSLLYKKYEEFLFSKNIISSVIEMPTISYFENAIQAENDNIKITKATINEEKFISNVKLKETQND